MEKDRIIDIKREFGYEDLCLLLHDRNWREITRRVVELSQALSQHENRKALDSHVLESLNAILSTTVTELKTGDEEITALATEVFRALRNSCVGEPANQTAIVLNTSAVDTTCEIMELISQKKICLRMCVQFLGNLVVNNTTTQPVVWNKCCCILQDLVSHEDDKVASYSCMVVYNILLGCPHIDLNTHMLPDVIEQGIKESEFALFIIELVLGRQGYLAHVYDELDVRHRLFLLDCLQGKTCFPVSCLEFLAGKFNTQADCILKTCEKYVETLEPVEVSKLLEVLASACAQSQYQCRLQSNASLLITCAMLLRSIHSLGKSGENNFSVIQKMADLSVPTRDTDILEHPAFGFKSSLVQMLANMCWKHVDNQNQIRELDCIPVLLDCCNIDARNPLIIQWVVLAIRNLCEDNRDNQAVIAGMTKQGVVDSKVLLEMGLTLQADQDSKIVMMPLQ